MTTDRTQQQSTEQQHRSQDLSLKRSAPPLAIAGYEPRQFLGSGAYGEVWVALDQNTGRRVAIKFYTHGGGLDWSLLAREVEKLVFLSADRYVVQLLDVGWNADPPYYVMEYVENGSLQHYLNERGPLPVADAVEIFREVATGLSRAHGKGVLHCDLKPANILLDQDQKPRLADFGQSRLSHEQTPALGTLFFMAPEQADLQALPDARWDVYALGAVLHAMLTGQPPYRSEEALSEIDATPDLEARLLHYRRFIETSPPPQAVRKLAGIDRPLLEILDRCLAVDPERRFPNIQSVLDALERRDTVRRRRPLVLLGIVGPLLFLLVTLLFAWRSQQRAVAMADQLLLQLAKQSNGFAADFVAEAVARRMESYFRAVEQAANDPQLQAELLAIVDNPELNEILGSLSGAHADSDRALRDFLQQHRDRRPLQDRMELLLKNPARPEIASWFTTDAHGIHVASAFDTPMEASPIGIDYSYRPYFHGGLRDEQPADHRHIQRTHLSAVFKSKVTDAWKVAISTPIIRDGEFLGIVALTVELGRLGDVLGSKSNEHQFNVLVDGRPGPDRGVILQHPLLTKMIAEHSVLNREFSTDPRYRVDLDRLTADPLYHDPLGNHPLGHAYKRRWIAAISHVALEGDPLDKERVPTDDLDTGLVVLVQENYELAAAPVLQLGDSLGRQAVFALSLVVLLITLLWLAVARALFGHGGWSRKTTLRKRTSSTIHDMETIELPPALRK